MISLGVRLISWPCQVTHSLSFMFQVLPPSSLVQFSASSAVSFPSALMLTRLSNIMEKKLSISSVFTLRGSVTSALVGIYIFTSPPVMGCGSGVDTGTAISSSFSPDVLLPQPEKTKSIAISSAVSLRKFFFV